MGLPRVQGTVFFVSEERPNVRKAVENGLAVAETVDLTGIRPPWRQALR